MPAGPAEGGAADESEWRCIHKNGHSATLTCHLAAGAFPRKRATLACAESRAGSEGAPVHLDRLAQGGTAWSGWPLTLTVPAATSTSTPLTLGSLPIPARTAVAQCSRLIPVTISERDRRA